MNPLSSIPSQAGETPVVQATRTPTPPSIDGRLDESVWHQAPTVADCDFFLEGAGIFEFGERVARQGLGGRPPTLLFYSRRIGIAEGHNLPVWAGGKLTGRAGPYQIGALRMTTEAGTFIGEEEQDRFLTQTAPYSTRTKSSCVRTPSSIPYS